MQPIAIGAMAEQPGGQRIGFASVINGTQHEIDK